MSIPQDQFAGRPTVQEDHTHRQYLEVLAHQQIRHRGLFSVLNYGAIGNGITDDTPFIQAAIDAASDAGGGVVEIPGGTWKLTSTLTLRSKVAIRGEGAATVIRQTSTSANAMTAVDVSDIALQGFILAGPGSGTGKGIAITRSAFPNTSYLSFRDIWIQTFGSHGISASNPIVSVFERVICSENDEYGFDFYGVVGGAAGTSLSLDSCYANANGTRGYSFYNMVYCSLNGCASDNNQVGYVFESCQGISVNGCGAEDIDNAGATDGGTSFLVNAGYGTGFYNCWVYDNGGKAFHVRNGATKVIVMGCVENTPGGSATAFIQTDSGTSAILGANTGTTANSLATGTATVLDGDASWTSLTLANSWVTFGAPYPTPAYRKDSSGFVHLRGLVKDGTATTVATLPVGYRPGSRVLWRSYHNNAAGTVTTGFILVESTGVITVEFTGTGAAAGLDVIDFLAEG